MRRSILLALLAAVLLPASALAAPAEISPRASAISKSGVATVEVANPNRHALRGTATVSVGRRTIARRKVRLPRRSIVTVSLRFDRRALDVLRAADGRATMRLRTRRSGGRPTTASRRLTLRSVAGVPQTPGGDAPSPAPNPNPVPGGDGSTGDPAPAPNPAPGNDGSTGDPAPAPVSDRWVGRMGTEGPYDDLELTVNDGQLQIATIPTVPVYCYENGGSYRTALSFELFNAPGPWTIGADGSVGKQGIALNQLVSSGARTITYKVTDTTQVTGRVAGTLGMSFFDSKYDVFSNTISYINCSGSQSFEAVPAAQ